MALSVWSARSVFLSAIQATRYWKRSSSLETVTVDIRNWANLDHSARSRSKGPKYHTASSAPKTRMIRGYFCSKGWAPGMKFVIMYSGRLPRSDLAALARSMVTAVADLNEFVVFCDT